MSADDQHFLDIFSSLPADIKRHSSDAAEAFDRQVDWAATQIRNTLASAAWLPDNVRPPSARPPPTSTRVPPTLYTKTCKWVHRHRVLVGLLVGCAGLVTYYAYRKRILRRRVRKARRAQNGDRVEVVVIAGAPGSILTQAVATDLEKRGFIVYITCSGHDEERSVQDMARPDIRPLVVDVTNPSSASHAIDSFVQYIRAPYTAVPGARPYHLRLSGLVLIPATTGFQAAPIATTSPSAFADLYNTHLLHPILTTQAFLPLLTIQHNTANSAAKLPKVLVLTPGVIAAINPPFHAAEASVCSALTSFIEVLAAELRPLGNSVTHIQLGSLDLLGHTLSQRQLTTTHRTQQARRGDSAVVTWPEASRRLYGRNYVTALHSSLVTGEMGSLKGTSPRELHHVVFDVLAGTRRDTVIRVGLGASIYGFIGTFVPRTIVGWMMGMQDVVKSPA